MTERQKKLVSEYGPRFAERAHEIENELLHLTADAASIMTDEEWAPCANALVEFVKELNKCYELSVSRMKEAGLPVR